MTILLAVLLASMLGSLHCAAMCGGIVCTYSAASTVPLGTTPTAGSSPVWAHAAYNAGRLVSYSALGAVAGAVGAGINTASVFSGIGQVAAVVSGVAMVVFGALGIARALGHRVSKLSVPIGVVRALGAIVASSSGRTPAVRAGLFGLVTTLIPCGWLYAFVAAAAGTGSMLGGVTVMGFFWAGTVPMLLFVGIGSRAVLARFSRRAPLFSGALVLLVGLLALAGRLRPIVVMGASSTHSHSSAVLDAQVGR